MSFDLIKDFAKRNAERMSTPEYIQGEEIVRTYSVNLRQEKVLNAWMNAHRKDCIWMDPDTYKGAIGGGPTFSFSDTSLGTVCKVKCICGTEVDITEYQDW
jgi:hypothetical protein